MPISRFSGTIYISFSSRNKRIVAALVDQVAQRDYNVTGFQDGLSDDEYLQDAPDLLKNADCLLVFVSSAYDESVRCRQELTYASEYGKKIVPVYLDCEAFLVVQKV